MAVRKSEDLPSTVGHQRMNWSPGLPPTPFSGRQKGFFAFQAYYKHCNTFHGSGIRKSWGRCNACRMFYPTLEVLKKHAE
jgi:hypothetical protein